MRPTRCFYTQQQQQQQQQHRTRLFTLVVREAADALTLVDSGANHDRVMSAWDQGRSSKFPLLLRHCSFGPLEHLSRSAHGMQEDICRVILQHAVFGDRLLETLSLCGRETFHGGNSGGYTKCKWICKEEASNLPPLLSLWH